MYDGKQGIQWTGVQLGDLLLPALATVETETGEGTMVGVKWIRRDVNGLWYHGLKDAIGEVIIDVAKLPMEQSFLLRRSHLEVDLPRASLRKILRARPTFKPADIKTRLNELVPLRLGPKNPWVYESLVDNFVEIEDAEVVIRPEEVRTDDLATNIEDEERMQQQAEASAWVVEDKNLRREKHTMAGYAEEIARIEDSFGVTYDKHRPFDTLSTPVLDYNSAYEIEETYARTGTEGRVYMAFQELARERERLTALMMGVLQKERELEEIKKQLVEENELWKRATSTLYAKVRQNKATESSIQSA